METKEERRIAMIKRLCLIFILLFSGCATTPINYPLSQIAIEQMNEAYNPMVEKGFCVNEHGISNIQIGTATTSPMPLCNVLDVVFHTHPFFAEEDANFADWSVWKEYQKRYGNKYFGLMYGKNKWKIYKR